MERHKATAYERYTAQYARSGGRIGTIYLEIERVPKESKYRTSAVPMIKLFCKSLGKCGV
jgi:hypothetical protein